MHTHKGKQASCWLSEACLYVLHAARGPTGHVGLIDDPAAQTVCWYLS